jgi:hypothetical protein
MWICNCKIAYNDPVLRPELDEAQARIYAECGEAMSGWVWSKQWKKVFVSESWALFPIISPPLCSIMMMGAHQVINKHPLALSLDAFFFCSVGQEKKGENANRFGKKQSVPSTTSILRPSIRTGVSSLAAPGITRTRVVLFKEHTIPSTRSGPLGLLTMTMTMTMAMAMMPDCQREFPDVSAVDKIIMETDERFKAGKETAPFFYLPLCKSQISIPTILA